jgi:hypothetical protein
MSGVTEEPPVFAGLSGNRRRTGLCHGRGRSGHPGLVCLGAVETWMPGTTPGMTGWMAKLIFTA